MSDPSTPTSIVLIISHLYPRFGLETAVLALAHSLSQSCDVRIICISQDEAIFKASKSDTEFVPVETWGHATRGFRRAVSAIWLRRRLRSVEADVIILCGAWAAIPSLLSFRKANLERVLVWEHSFDSKKVRSNRSLRVLRTIAKGLYGRAASIICVSEKLLSDLDDAGFKGRKVVIPNIIDINYDFEIGQRKFGRLICVGTLSRTKNQALAIEALSLLPERYTLDIVGDGPERVALERLAQSRDVTNRVEFHGYLHDPIKLMRHAAMLVHPALGETFGIVLFEASSVGIPVVALNQSVMVDFVPDLIPGLLAHPTAISFADAIMELGANPPATEEFEKARARRKGMISDAKARWRREIKLVVERGDGAH